MCFAHDPRRGRERAQARKRGGHNRRTPAASTAETLAVSLRDVESIRTLLEAAVADTLVQANSSQRSRTLGYLLGVALKALEMGEFESRITSLERQLGDRLGAA